MRYFLIFFTEKGKWRKILFITTILQLSNFENSFGAKFEIVQISLDYRDNFGIFK